jgi:hypothetical protein
MRCPFSLDWSIRVMAGAMCFALCAGGSAQEAAARGPTSADNDAATARLDRVSHAPNGVIQVNGKPFFPLGVYAHSGARGIKENIEQAAAGGMNLVIASRWRPASGGLISQADYAAALDAAQHTGVAIVHNTDSRNPDPADKVATALAYRAHPATFGTYISDDSHDYMTRAQLATIQRRVKAADPNHLTMISDYGFTDDIVFNYGIADVSSAYWYPVLSGRTAYLGNVVHALDVAKRRCPSCPLVPSIQSFAWPGGRMPTPDELRNMSFAALISGANGLVYYEFDGPDVDLLRYPVTWSALQRVVAEVHGLSNVWLRGRRTRLNLGADVQGASWSVGAKTTIVLANMTYAQRSVTLPDALQASRYRILGARAGTLSGSSGKWVATLNEAAVLVLVGR